VEERLQRSEARLRALFAAMSDVILVVDREGCYREVAPTGTELPGRPVDEVVGKKLHELLPPETAALTLAWVRRALQTRTRLVADFPLPVGGARRIFSTTFSSISGDEVLIVGRDVSEQRRREAELRQLSRVVEQTSESVMICERSGAISYVNPAFQQETGWSQAEAAGKKPSILNSAHHDAAFFAQLWRTVVAGEVWQGTILNKRRNGQLHWVERTITPLRDEAGQVTHFVATGRDVTEQQRAEQERAQRTRRVEMLDEVSQALVGVTHDYGSALRVVVRRAAELLGDLCVLARITPGTGQLQALAAHDRDPDHADLLARLLLMAPLPATAPGLERMLHTGHPLLLNDAPPAVVGSFFAPEHQGDLDQLGLRSLMLAPMRGGGRIGGVMLLGRRTGGQPFLTEDVVFAQELADRAEVAVEGAWLYEENARQAEELRRANAELEQRVAERTAELARANEQLTRLAVEDGLTGLANRRRLNEVLDREVRRARRDSLSIALLLCDVDHFKRYNDRLGHLAGDTCLQAVAGLLKALFKRAAELPARYGGEEFAVVLPGCGVEEARAQGDRLREAVAGLRLAHPDSPVAGWVTVSVGAVSTKPASGVDGEWFLRKADEALYRSKQAGRDRVSLAEE
jgi:diguanylate cyclase (GGDEF)-like protein/PAS domain S-box-containing protein